MTKEEMAIGVGGHNVHSFWAFGRHRAIWLFHFFLFFFENWGFLSSSFHNFRSITCDLFDEIFLP